MLFGRGKHFKEAWCQFIICLHLMLAFANKYMSMGSTQQKANIVRKTQILEEITLAIFGILHQTYLQKPIRLTWQVF